MTAKIIEFPNIKKDTAPYNDNPPCNDNHDEQVLNGFQTPLLRSLLVDTAATNQAIKDCPLKVLQKQYENEGASKLETHLFIIDDVLEALEEDINNSQISNKDFTDDWTTKAMLEQLADQLIRLSKKGE